MERFIIDERTGWEYELKGEQYYPTGRVMKDGVMTPLEIPEDNEPEENNYIGIWGQRHLQYIRQFNKRLYFDLYISGKLNAYLAEINAQAEDFFLRTVKEMAMCEGVTEKLKTENQIAWVQKMNDIRDCAAEIVNKEFVFN